MELGIHTGAGIGGSPALIDFHYRKAQHEALSLKKEV
jgi:hypothetical protein